MVAGVIMLAARASESMKVRGWFSEEREEDSPSLFGQINPNFFGSTDPN